MVRASQATIDAGQRPQHPRAVQGEMHRREICPVLLYDLEVDKGRKSLMTMGEPSEQKSAGTLWSELKRRRVIRVIVLYAVAGWAVIEVASTVLPNLSLPEWTVTLVTVLVALGFVLAIILAWAFDIGPGGVHRTQPADTAAAAPAEPDTAEPEREAELKGEAAEATKLFDQLIKQHPETDFAKEAAERLQQLALRTDDTLRLQ